MLLSFCAFYSFAYLLSFSVVAPRGVVHSLLVFSLNNFLHVTFMLSLSLSLSLSLCVCVCVCVCVCDF